MLPLGQLPHVQSVVRYVMAHLFCQVVMPYFTKLPKDVAVNTFHFRTPGDDLPEEAAEAAQRITIFYNNTYGSMTHPLAYYLSPVIDRTTDACTIKVFDMADAKPRTPIYQEDWTLGASASTKGLPSEVAAVFSFQGARMSGHAQSRRRGRLFIGPLGEEALTFGSASAFPSLAGGLISNGVAAAHNLAVAGVWLPIWCVYSRVNDNLVTVTNGWLDNDFDTQRSRGPRATTRNTWTTVLP